MLVARLRSEPRSPMRVDPSLMLADMKSRCLAIENTEFSSTAASGNAISTWLTNYFQVVKEQFPDDWNPKSYFEDDGKPKKGSTPVLRRTVGYEALMRALTLIWPVIERDANIEQSAFLPLVTQFKRNVAGVDLNTDNFGSSSAKAGELAAMFSRGIVA